MAKKAVQQTQHAEHSVEKHKKSKANRFDDVLEEPNLTNKKNWPTNAVVYIGHLPHGFYEDQLKQYFGQYGEVLGVKVARSRKTARSRGYAFVQFKYSQVAQIVARTMNGYLLLGKVLVSQVLAPNIRNPFSFTSSRKYKFINWKRIFMKEINRQKSQQQITKEVTGLLNNEQKKRQKLKSLGIEYNYPGFSSYIKSK